MEAREYAEPEWKEKINAFWDFIPVTRERRYS